MTGKKPRPPRGMRDLPAAAMKRRQWVLDTLVEVFESYGYEPLDTPAMEEAAILFDKYGPDAERLIYRAGLRGRSDLALRYDLSVPLARVAAANEELPLPYRRYQFGPVWRGERPQRGRYREFVQADVDVIGSDSMLADAEIIAITVSGLRRLGFEDTLTKLNNRHLLNAIGSFAGVPAAILPGLYRAIDKLEKIGLEGVRLELRAVGLPPDLMNRQRQAVERWLRGQADRDRLESDLAAAVPDDAPPGVLDSALPAFFDALTAYPSGAGESELEEARQSVLASSIDALRDVYPRDELLAATVVDRLLKLLQLKGKPRELLSELAGRLDSPEATVGTNELTEVLDALASVGIPEQSCSIDFAMVRGLEYYTGTIFETVVSKPPVGSITGGGRYDELIGLFGRDLPAVGTSFGIDRLVDVMDELGMFPETVDQPSTEVVVARYDESTTPMALEVAAALREAGVNVELNLALDGLGDQIREAVRRSIPVIAIVGPDEAAARAVTIRDLSQKSQVTVPFDEAAGAARAALADDS